MATGREIRQIYNAMKRICAESSQMLKIIRDHFDGSGFRNLGGATVMWDISDKLEEASWWLPYFQQMLFAPKDQTQPKKAVGVNILFDDPTGGIDNVIPFVTCGLLSWEKGSAERRSDHLWEAGWCVGDEPPWPNTTFASPLYRTVFPEPKSDCKEITFYLLPLEELKSEDAVVSLVVKPLLELYKGEREKVSSRIQRVAITFEQVKGENVDGG